MIKDGIPESLLVDGHNPLTVLYTALSAGIHGQTDELCLERAASIRLVLADWTLLQTIQSVPSMHVRYDLLNLFQPKKSGGSQ